MTLDALDSFALAERALEKSDASATRQFGAGASSRGMATLEGR